MEHREAVLLQNALCYEEGHPRRTQHILKEYALAALLAEQGNLPRGPAAGAGGSGHFTRHCHPVLQGALRRRCQPGKPAAMGAGSGAESFAGSRLS